MIPIVAPVPLMILPTAGAMVGAAELGFEFLAIMEPGADIAEVNEVELHAPGSADMGGQIIGLAQTAMPLPLPLIVDGHDGVGPDETASQKLIFDISDKSVDLTASNPVAPELGPKAVAVDNVSNFAPPVFEPNLLPQMAAKSHHPTLIDQTGYTGEQGVHDVSIPLATALQAGVEGAKRMQQVPVDVMPDIARPVSGTATAALEVAPLIHLLDVATSYTSHRPETLARDTLPMLDDDFQPRVTLQLPVSLQSDPSIDPSGQPRLVSPSKPVEAIPQNSFTQVPEGHSTPPVRKVADIIRDSATLADIPPVLRQHIATVPRSTTAERAFATRLSQSAHQPIIPIETLSVPLDLKAAFVMVIGTDTSAVANSPTVASPVAIDGALANLTATSPISMALSVPIPLPDIDQLPVTYSGDRLLIASPIPLQTLPATIAQIASAPGSATVEIRLDPVELGAIQVTMQGTERDISIVVMVDRPDTLDLLRRHADQFLSDLRQSGFSGANLTFNLSDQNSAAQRQPTPSQTIQQNFTPQPSIPDHQPVLKSSGGLDMRL